MVKPRRKLNRLQRLGDPAHINAMEDRLLREWMPESHGEVVRRGLLAEAGRRGDDRVTKLIPAEAALLKAHGGSGTINPATGWREYGNTDGESGRSGGDANPGGVGGGPAGGQTGGGLGGNTADGQGGLGGGYGDNGYAGSANQKKAEELGNYYRDNYIDGIVDTPYAPKDTWMRVWQEFWNPSVPTNRYGPTTKHDMGIMGTVVNKLSGTPMGAVMGVGAAMGRAQSPEQQEASMAHNQSLGSQNSTGQDHDDFGSARAGGSSSVNTGLLGEKAPGQGRSEVPTMNLDQGTLPTVGSLTKDNQNSTPNLLPQLIKNEMADYIWRGRGGLGLGSW